MAVFKYTAKDIESNVITGKHDADDKHELAVFLRSQNLFLIKCRELPAQEDNINKIKLNELSDFSRQLSAMLSSGVSLIRAMEILLRRKHKPQVHLIYENLYRMLQQGNTLSDAMEAQGKAFPPLMISMFRAGESSGQLDKAAKKISDQYAKDYRLHNKLKSASTYPIILLITTCVVVFAVFKFILPSFFEMFDKVELPWITTVVIKISEVVNEYWMFLIIGILCLIGLIAILVNVPSVRYQYDRCKVKALKIGWLMQIIYTARFARTLCSLYNSGISIVSALQIVRDTMGNTYIEAQFDQLIRDVRNGTALSTAIQQIDGFDQKLSSNIAVGEESGKLEDMLESIADEFDYESEEATQRLVTLMEPLLIIFMALIIGTIMISVMLPIFQLYQNTSAFT